MRNWRSVLKPVRHRPYIVYHDAYPYLEAHYGLDAIGAVTVEPDRPVGPRRIANLRAAIKAGRGRHASSANRNFRRPLSRRWRGTRQCASVCSTRSGADLKPGPQLYPAMMRQLAARLGRMPLAPVGERSRKFLAPGRRAR